MEVEYEIKNVCGHYEVYVNGRWFCSADTTQEAIRELQKEGYAA